MVNLRKPCLCCNTHVIIHFFVLINHVFKCAHILFRRFMRECVCVSITLHSLKCKGHRASDTQRSTRLRLSFALGVNALEDAPVCTETMPGLCTQESGFFPLSPTSQSQHFWIYTLCYSQPVSFSKSTLFCLGKCMSLHLCQMHSPSAQ